MSILLLTGAPGVGKTTVLATVAERLAGRAKGFLTREVREEGRRIGFRVTTFDGRSCWLAHATSPSRHRVGAYGVEPKDFEALAVPALCPNGPRDAVWLIDEIGRMECLSPRFVAATRTILDSGRPVVASVALRGRSFVAEVKRRNDIELWEATEENRDEMPDRILQWLDA